jgi:hypothetical protein
VYWANGGEIMRVAISGGNVENLIQDQNQFIDAITADSEGVYWHELSVGFSDKPVAGAIYWANKSGTKQQITAVSGAICPMAIFSGRIFWPENNTIKTIKRDGAAPESIATTKENDIGLFGISDGELIWREGSCIKASKFDGGGNRILQLNVSTLYGTGAVDSDNFYYLSGASPSESLHQVALKNADINLICQRSEILDYSVSGKNVYWLDYNPTVGVGSLRSISTTGQNQQKIVTNISQPGNLAVDSSKIIWTALKQTDVSTSWVIKTTALTDFSTTENGVQSPVYSAPLLIQSGRVYWVERGATWQDNDRIKTISPQNGMLETLAVADGKITAIAVDVDGVYSLEAPSSLPLKLLKRSLDGSNATTIATGIENNFNLIGLDQNSVYVGRQLYQIPHAHFTVQRFGKIGMKSDLFADNEMGVGWGNCCGLQCDGKFMYLNTDSSVQAISTTDGTKKKLVDCISTHTASFMKVGDGKIFWVEDHFPDIIN